MDAAMLTDGVVRLRAVRLPQDIEAALLWYQDPEVLRWSQTDRATPMSRERVEKMYAYLAAHGEFYMIEVVEDGGFRPIGDVGMQPDTLPIVIGDRGWWGRGIGTRVLRLLIVRARQLGWPSLQAKYIHHDNERSRRLFRRLGFQLVETGTDKHGQPFERYRLDLIRETSDGKPSPD